MWVKSKLLAIWAAAILYQPAATGLDSNDLDKKTKSISTEKLSEWWCRVNSVLDWVRLSLLNVFTGYTFNKESLVNFNDLEDSKRKLIQDAWVDIWDISCIYKEKFNYTNKKAFDNNDLYYVEMSDDRLWIIVPNANFNTLWLTQAFANQRAQSLGFRWKKYLNNIRSSDYTFIIYSK